MLSSFLMPLQAQDSTYQLRVMQYNLLNFGVNAGECSFDPQRYETLETVLTHYKPHVFAVNEIGLSSLYPTNILNESFTYTSTMAKTTSTNQAGGDRTNHLFYDESLFELVEESVIPTSNLRDINRYVLSFKPSWAGGDTVNVTCLVAHLKAGRNTSDANLRANAAADIMAWVQANGQGQNLLLLGDLNLSSSSESAFQQLISPSSGSLAWQDPINSLTGWDGSAFAGIHTQSTKASGDACFSGGGLDDRFDFILTSAPVLDGSAGITYVPGSYKALGNAGNSFNGELICGPDNPTVPATVCLALRNMSDHLPVVMTMEINGEIMTSLNTWARSIRVHPNPFSQKLDLAMPTVRPGNLPLALQVMDAQGKVRHTQHWQGDATNLAIGTDNWPSGLYLLTLRDQAGRIWQRKLLKEN